jgi:hypothetical protein
LLAACGAGQSHRSTANVKGSQPILAGIQRIRIEVENGTVGVAPGAERVVRWAGGVRRAADSAAELAVLETLGGDLVPVVNPAEPDLLLLRGPRLPDGANGLLGFELGVHVPADLPLELVVLGSGHLTASARQAPTRATTGRGDLRFEGCAGGVTAKTGRGHVIAFEHRGDIDIHTMVGDMQVFVREPGSRIRLVTGRGNVQCHVPPEAGFVLDARAESGVCHNGFGLTTEKVGAYGGVMVGRQGAGDTKVVLRTAEGHLSMTKKLFE